MRSSLFALAFVFGGLVVITGQIRLDLSLQAQLKRVFPTATNFSAKEGSPPHFKAFNGQTLLGFAYWTTELEPLERGFDGPIKVLVGIDTKGVLSNILVVEHREPYGDFSVDLPAFAAQFHSKSIRDPFRVGEDIDAVSRATMSITSATRAIRNSSRRVARALLTPESVK